MSDFDLIDVESLDFFDDQTWLYKLPEDSGQKVDIVDWCLSLDWPVYDDEDYQSTEQELYAMLDELMKKQVLAMPDKQKFDSRTYVKPKKFAQRPSINTLMENSPSLNSSGNKFLTYNKYNNPLGQILRLKTFNVDANTENSNAVKEYAMKRKSQLQDEDPQLEDMDMTLISETSDRLSSENMPTKPINIDYSQPAHNIHNTFNKGVMMNDRGSLNMYQSGESLMRMSPPSLVSSLLMDNSGNYNLESLESRKSITVNRDSSAHQQSGRESMDNMITSMTLSILDVKDMSTSFLSQSTYPDNDNLMDSLPPSLVSSVNSSFVVSSNTPRARTDSVESNNVFSSATFTHLEQSEKLLSARPRHQMYNSFKRETPMRCSSSYTKAKEEGCQMDTVKVLNENLDKKDTPKASKSNEMTETITLHYSNRFRKNNDAEKENLNASFEKDDAFYKEMGIQRPVDLGKNSLNVTLDKQELNEIIQARQKLSMARKALPTENLPNQVDSPTKIISNQTIAMPRKSMENASELLSRRRMVTNGHDKEEVVREPPKRNATFKKMSPKTLVLGDALNATVVYVNDGNEENIIDINSATMNLVDSSERTLHNEEWGSQDRAMVASSESTDTATFSSSSPPDSVPDTSAVKDTHVQVASTPLPVTKVTKEGRTDLLNLHHKFSPIYNMIDDKSYTVTKAPSSTSSDTPYNTTVINTATLVKKRDVLKNSPEKKILPAPQFKMPVKTLSAASYTISGVPPVSIARKTSLPTSKMRQYSSHKELRIPTTSNSGANILAARVAGRTMIRRGVYASNPALSPTAPPSGPLHPPLSRRDSYTVVSEEAHQDVKSEPPKPVVTNPPTLVRQGTETLRRERPQSQIIQPKDLRTSVAHSGAGVPLRHINKVLTRPYSIAVPTSQRLARPISVPKQQAVAPPVVEQRPFSCQEQRVSALPRPTRLPGPRRTLRPPSVYSVAPTADVDQY